jgi:hypothetical protein
MASKGVTDRQKVAGAIVAAARTHAESVGEQLRQTLSVVLEDGETFPDQTLFLRLLARYLGRQTEGIVTADEAHLRELGDDRIPRRRRDEATAALYSTVVGIRDALNSAFGRERALEVLNIDGETSDEPVVLLRQANRTLEVLRQPPPDAPPLRVQGLAVDFETMATQLQPALDDLTRTVDEINDELRQQETTLQAKDLALDSFDAAVSGIGRILIGCDQLVGFRKFAEKIRLRRPSRRRNGTGGENVAGPGPDEAPDGVPEDAPIPEPAPDAEPSEPAV